MDSNGGLDKNIQNYEYQDNSAIHGMVFGPSETYLYSADMWANKIWTHRKDQETGMLETVHSLDAPSPGDHPRWVAIHPNGHYLYVLMEAGNNLAVYVIDEHTHFPVFTHLTYPLIPPGMSDSLQLQKEHEHDTNSSRPTTAQKPLSIRYRHHQPQHQIPLRHGTLQRPQNPRLHHCIPPRYRRQYRKTAIHQSYINKRRSFKRN